MRTGCLISHLFRLGHFQFQNNYFSSFPSFRIVIAQMKRGETTNSFVKFFVVRFVNLFSLLFILILGLAYLIFGIRGLGSCELVIDVAFLFRESFIGTFNLW